MNDIAIQVDNLSKRYRIGRGQAGRSNYGSLRETLADAASAPLRRLRRSNNGDSQAHTDSIWALKDVSFEVKKGEVVGIIGRNGAGKTTLLKVLSRITRPTRGSVRLWGRVGSLLEVGTGFHPELTGRENIYLNGVVLGMGRVEIEHKFDEMVDFAEIEQFLDTPVKRYSSGMYMRLAFAVAAHLEPEILLVDEVLAVGDAAFQKKCLGKMGEVAREGRTVLFVSHNMGAISRICQRSLLIQHGRLKEDGLPPDVISKYFALQKNQENSTRFLQPLNKNIPICLLEAEVNSNGDFIPPDKIPRHKSIIFNLQYHVNRYVSAAHVYSQVLTDDGEVVLGTSDTDIEKIRLGNRKPGTYKCQFEIPARILNEGRYNLNITLGIPYQENFQSNERILSFDVVDVETSEGYIHHKRKGTIWLDIPWKYFGNDPGKKK